MTNARLIWLLFAITIVLMTVLRFQNQNLITPAAPAGVLSLEFSTTAAQTENIRSEWNGDRTMTFYFHIVLDYFFILFYGLFLYFTCLYITLVEPRLKHFGRIAMWAALAGAGLDAIENALLLTSVTIGSFDLLSIATAVAAGLKFALVGIAVIFILFGTARRLFK